MEEFVKYLITLLESGYTQKQIAELAGTKQATISRWVKRKQEPRLGNFVKLCRNMKVSADEILQLKVKGE